MSTQTICDSCGTPCETVERGLIKKLDYCGDCAQAVDAYLDARDELHTASVARWDEEMADLRKQFDGVRLPDE